MLRRFVFAAALALSAGAMAGLAVAGVPRLFADKRSNAVPVDVELVIAVDVSYSMDPDEQALQREGYILALTSRNFCKPCARARTARLPLHILNGRANSIRR